MSHPTKVKKLLILTSSTGAGHDAHARATAEWCEKIYGQAVEVKVEQLLENSSGFNRLLVDFYGVVQRRVPWFHHFYFYLVDFFLSLNPGIVVFGRSYYLRLLKEFRPDAILSVHFCLNPGYLEVARKVLGPDLVWAIYCLEFSGGYGFSRFWIDRRADYHFVRTPDTLRYTRARHLPADRVRVAGHWSRPASYQPLFTETQRMEHLVRLGLKPDRFTLILSSGGSGAQNHRSILQELASLGDRIQVVALCGRNPADRARLQSFAADRVAFPVVVLSFTDDFPLLLRCASAIVARPGAATAGEALLVGCPLIFNTIGGIMPQEVPTWRYFKEHGVGQRFSHPAALTPIVREWIEQPEVYAAWKKRLESLRQPETPEASLALFWKRPS
jgi:processive 1,2-diacylglycerol beta-glucosyltransferase